MELNVEEILKSSLDLKSVGSMPQKLNDMRKKNEFCDVTLKINNRDLFRVHKAIIASSCDYFNGLLTSESKKTREDVISVDYEIIPECFELLLEYLYIGKLNISVITYGNALILHKAAVFFKMPQLKSIMSEILRKFITTETVLDLWRHGVNNSDDPLMDKCTELITKNTKEFLNQCLINLTLEELTSLSNNKILNCTQEELYENFMKWTKADLEHRESHLKVLLDLVDFSKISGKFVKSKILNDKILFKNEDIVKKIMDELSNSFDVTARNISESTETDGKKLFILLISDTGVFKIDMEQKNCELLLSHSVGIGFDISKFGTNHILLCGGGNSRVFKYYCPEINSFRELPSILEERYGHKAIALSDKIYVFGGNHSNTMEIFDKGTGKWSFGPKMPRSRWHFALEEYSGYIYLMGGHGELNSKSMPTDVFDIKRSKWETYSTLRPFECFKSVRIDNTGYLFKNDRYHKYDFKNKLLKENCFIFQKKLSYYDAVKYNNNIFLFGKKSSGETYSALIDIAVDKLTEIKIDLTLCGDVGYTNLLETAFL